MLKNILKRLGINIYRAPTIVKDYPVRLIISLEGHQMVLGYYTRALAKQVKAEIDKARRSKKTTIMVIGSALTETNREASVEVELRIKAINAVGIFVEY